MNLPDLTNLEARLDRDRREQERDLLLLLLAFMAQSRNRADAALSLGSSPYAAVADVFAGNVALRMPPAWPRVARRLIAADVAGYRRTVRVVGDLAEADGYVPVVDHGSIARQMVARLLQNVQGAIARALADAAVKGVPVRRAVAEAFVRAGLVESATNKAFYLRNTAEVLIGFAYQAGYFGGWFRPSLAGVLTGFEYVTVHDDRRTEICKAYDGVKLPRDHPWWLTHWPLNHWGCRSFAKPLFKAFVPTASPPWQPAPAPGFGRAPAIATGVRFQPAA